MNEFFTELVKGNYLISLAVAFISFLVLCFIAYKKGIKIGKLIVIPSSKENKQIQEHLQISLKEKEELLSIFRKPDFFKKVNNEYIGFFVDKIPSIMIFGKVWNTNEHYEAIDLLRQLWNNQESIGLMGSNIPSDILALIEEKLKYLNRLEIHCTTEQEKLLKNYLQKHGDKVNIVGR